MQSSSTSVLLTLALLAAGCAADAPTDAVATHTATRPDGATLVRHTPPVAGVPVTWTLQEELRIGTMDGGGPAQFGRVGGLAVARDGRMAVLDAQAQEVRVFAPDGRHLRTLGGKGGGPGELAAANGLLLTPGGLLLVPDGQNNRVSYYDLETGFVRSHPYAPLYRTWMLDGVLADDGSFRAVHYVPSTEPGQRGRTVYVGYDSAGTPLDTIPHPEVQIDPSRDQPGIWTIMRDGRPMVSIDVPMYARQRHVLAPDLSVWTTPEGDPAYRLERSTPDGPVTLTIEMDRPLQPADRAKADSLASEMEARFDASLDRSKIPDTAPAIHDLFLDDDRRLWVAAHTAHADSVRTLDAFDPDDGRWLGTLATPLPVTTDPAPVIRGDTLWAVLRDELDVPYVIRARLVAPAPR